MTEPWRMGAGELAAAIRGGDLSSREVVASHLARIEEVNPRLNAIVVTMADEAMAAAADADDRQARGEATGPLHGVPITVKENVDVAGTATTWGVTALAGAVAPHDAPQVAHLRAAGAIPVGRTNMPDFALRWHTDNGLRGATLNPWDPARTPGGSSGGEAAALATGMTPLGVGNDLGGSLRWPSQCCGTAALRPTLGRIPQATAIEPVDSPMGTQLLNVQGPMARHVRDLRLALEVMSRPSPRDPWYSPAPLAGPSPDSPVRVALVRDPAGLGVDPQVADGLDRAARELADAGYVVDEVEPPSVARAAELWGQFIAADLGLTLPMIEPLLCADAAQFLTIAVGLLPPMDLGAHQAALMARQGLLRDWSEFLADHALVLAPIGTSPPFEVGADLTAEGAASVLGSMRMTVAVNALGLPSVAVPVGVADGLPQAVQLIGARYREDVCLDAAEILEARLGVPTPIDPR